MLGEIGGSMEEESAAYIKKSVTKPVVSLIVGRHAPIGERMGHAGAIVQHGKGLATDKLNALKAVGVQVVMGPRDIPLALNKFLS